MYKDIPIRIELVQEINKHVQAGRYTSISEFVKESVRLRLDQLRNWEVPDSGSPSAR
jgi:Arc/MetJ-type ribon-helix-helix transcriptional regulator